MSPIHLICNAHLDPAWLWEWSEGAAEALSTFRSAVELCESDGELVFNHNEALLYSWIEQHEPQLLDRIRALVRRGGWRVMGGWFLQPDCTMPCGESFVRQILWGRKYFREKLGSRPTTAVNLDSFGHSQGLVQILAKAGYDSYLFCRPREEQLALPAPDFQWVGLEGSRIMAHRVEDHYDSAPGEAAAKIRRWRRRHPGAQTGILLWGVGDHGGGPSRLDLRRISALVRASAGGALRHSWPEAYFEELRGEARADKGLPPVAADLTPWGVGCYTSQIRIKQSHRKLENEFLLTEKLVSQAVLCGLLVYPLEEMRQALYDLLLAQFHDVLAGSGVAEVENWGLQLMDHGLEILSRLKTRTFFAFSRSQPAAGRGQFPILVYNPHPFPVEGIWECELNLPADNRSGTVSFPSLRREGRRLPCQLEKESSNLNIDWRKRISFQARLQPACLNRFECGMRRREPPRRPVPRRRGGSWVFASEVLQVRIDPDSGLVDGYRVAGAELLRREAFRPLVMRDDADPWGMRVRGFRQRIGEFRLMEPGQASWFSGGARGGRPPVRLVEDGEVRSVVEALFSYGSSFLCIHYSIPRRGTEVGVFVRVYWNEKNQMLKLSIPTLLSAARCLGQVPFGVQELATNGEENVCQQWIALVDDAANLAVSCVNDGTYGSDAADGELRLSLLRSPAYAAHPFPGRPFMPDRRFIPHVDQGERTFRFWINGGDKSQRLELVDREALAHNQRPMALSMSPAGEGTPTGCALRIHGAGVQLCAFKPREDGSQGQVLRLFESTGVQRSVEIEIPPLGIRQPIGFRPFEVKTLLLDAARRKLAETDLLEEQAPLP